MTKGKTDAAQGNIAIGDTTCLVCGSILESRSIAAPIKETDFIAFLNCEIANSSGLANYGRVQMLQEIIEYIRKAEN